MQVTVDLPGDLAPQLQQAGSEHLAQILAMGLREWKSSGAREFGGLSAVLEQLARLPEPQDVLALRPSEELQSRASKLLAKSKAVGLTAHEEAEWQGIEFVEHLVRIAKANAAMKLKRE